MRKNKFFIISVSAIACSFFVLGASIYLALRETKINNKTKVESSQNTDLEKQNKEKIPIRPITVYDHYRGDLKAKVQIIVYSDFECPYCAEFSDIIKQAEKEFGNSIVVAYRHYTLSRHEMAMPAAIASECAGEQGKFWEMHDKLFNNAKSDKLNKEQMKKDAKELKLDEAQFNRCFESPKYKTKILNDLIEAKQNGADGTPTVVIDDYIYIGSYTMDDEGENKGLRSIIKDRLSK